MSAVITPSLLVGSDTIGWVELGGKAAIGQMTKAMPGGDGSLGFVLRGDDAWKARNVIIPGDSRVILSVGGEVLWGGRISTDPIRHRLSCQSEVEVGCSGLYGLSARDGRYAYVGIDTDLEQWRQFRSISQHAGRFTVKTDGVLEIRADTDRTYASGDCALLFYTHSDGLSSVPGSSIYSIGFEYKCNLPANWKWALLGGTDPQDAVDEDSPWYYEAGATSQSSWAALSIPYDEFGPRECLALLLSTTAAGSPGSDPFIRLRKVRLGGTTSAGNEDVELMIGDILGDVAAYLGVTNVRIDDTLSAYAVEQFVARFPTDPAETMRQATNLYTAPIESFFDLDPVDRSERYTGRVRPDDTDLSPENRLWVVGGANGENTDNLLRDWEATPEQIAVLYGVKDDADGWPDGSVRRVDYPGGDESDLPCAETVDLTSDRGLMSAATAANYAQAIYAARQSNAYTGDVELGQMAHAENGRQEPTYRLRPGDRLTALDRDNTDRFGETLYVTGAAYDWQTHRATVTVGEPDDPLETGYRGKGSYKVRTGIA